MVADRGMAKRAVRDAVGREREREERASGPSRADCCTVVGRTRVHLRIKMTGVLMRSRFQIQIDGSGMVALPNG